MDESHLYAAVRYVELNPVRAKLCTSAREWKCSSAKAHLSGQDDGLVEVRPMLDRVDDWEHYLLLHDNEVTDEAIRKHSQTGPIYYPLSKICSWNIVNTAFHRPRLSRSL